MKLIVGLGNPGSEYEATRHNAGFMLLARLVQRHGLTGIRARFHSAAIEGQIGGDKVLLLQPQTFMNKSGLAVGEAVTFYKLDPTADLLVVVDDVALSVGTIRLRARGSAGGHNGLGDIERVLSTREYARLRIGIDPPGRAPQRDYVLGRFSPQQRQELDPALDRGCDAAELWIAQGIEAAMNRYNGG